MLVLSRKIGEKLVIGDGIIVVVNRIAGNRVTLGIEAPQEIRIVRGELKPAVGAFARSENSGPLAAVLAELGHERDAECDAPLRLAK